MRVLVISGSRNPEGQTARATGALVEGAQEQGVEVEQAFLPALRVERCRQCGNDGWGTCITQGRCVIEDDLAGLAEKMRAADAVVFATPVYFGDLSESLKAFLDRLRRTCMHDAGKEGIRGTPAIGICVAGGGGGGAPSCAVSLERVLHTCGFDLVDVIPVRRQNLEMKQALLRETGRWLASVSPATK